MVIRWVTQATLNERKEICQECEFRKPGLIDVCSKCGCALKAKQMLKNQTCPIQKW